MHLSFSLEEPFTLPGTWWIPSEPEVKPQKGTLSFEIGKLITLQLDGFSALSNENWRGFGRYTQTGPQVIKGTTKTGHSLLLFETQHLAFNIFYPNLVLISENEIPWNTPEQIACKHLTTRYTHLETWRGAGFPFSESRSDSQQFTITYSAPKKLIIPLNSLDAEIQFIPHSPWSISQTEASIKYKLSTDILVPEPQPLNWLLEQLQHVQDLIALLVGQPVEKIEVAALVKNNETSNNISQTINIIHSVPTPKPIKRVSFNSILSAPMIEEQLPAIMEAWFKQEMIDIWEIIRHNLFGVQYETISTNRFRFLALTQTLESYHRRKFGGQYLSEEEYEPIRETLVHAIPDHVKSDHRASLKSRLKYGYQFSQRKRFAQLVKQLNEEIQEILGVNDKLYQQRLFETRNYFTHYETDDDTLLFDGLELMEANPKLAHMIIALILLEDLKLPIEKVADFLKTRREMGFFR